MDRWPHEDEENTKPNDGKEISSRVIVKVQLIDEIIAEETDQITPPCTSI
jgi:hypothetical protein